MDYTENWIKQNPENFPVASWWLPVEFRSQIMALYGFARGADEIADDPIMAPDNKRRKLSQLEDMLMSSKSQDAPEWAIPFLELAKSHTRLATHGRDLLSAFLQDTQKTSYADFDELLNYCLRSAAPVGRAVLDIAREEKANRNAADNLCMALQLLNHTQDISKDFLVLRRVYLPSDWMREAGVDIEDLSRSHSTKAVSKVIERLLAETERMLVKAAPLPESISHGMLRKELTLILKLAWALRRKLAQNDPLKTRITLSGFEKLSCLVRTWFSFS